MRGIGQCGRHSTAQSFQSESGTEQVGMMLCMECWHGIRPGRFVRRGCRAGEQGERGAHAEETSRGARMHPRTLAERHPCCIVLWYESARSSARSGYIAGMPRLLIADDHPLFRLALAQALCEVVPGSDVLEAGSLAQARECLEAETDIDLILLDLHMPDSHGLMGLTALRSEHPGIAVVMIS